MCLNGGYGVAVALQLVELSVRVQLPIATHGEKKTCLSAGLFLATMWSYMGVEGRRREGVEAG